MKKSLFELILSIKRKCQTNEETIQNELGITQAELNGLLVLNKEEKIPANHFAARMNLSPSRGSRVLNKLVTSGYVKTHFIPEDRRSLLIALTSEGIGMKTNILDRMAACEEKICQKIDSNRIDEIRASLELLAEAL